MAQAELIQDKDHPLCYRVECILEDGSVEVSIFCGPNSLRRAYLFGAFSRCYSSVSNHPDILSEAQKRVWDREVAGE